MAQGKVRKWIGTIVAVGTLGVGVYAALGQAQQSVVGEQITVNAGPEASGKVVGEEINVTGGQGTKGTVIGKQIIMNAGPLPAGPKIGSDSTVVGTLLPGTVIGDRSTVVGATDERGNTIINQGGTAIGYCAHADATSVAIGSYAGAGSGEGCRR